MLTPMRFKIGDRVTTRYLPAGSIGTVVRVYNVVRAGYDVAYSDHGLALLWGSELDRVVDAPPPNQQRRTRPPAAVLSWLWRSAGDRMRRVIGLVPVLCTAP